MNYNQNANFPPPCFEAFEEAHSALMASIHKLLDYVGTVVRSYGS
jgi:hypothetical protein